MDCLFCKIIKGEIPSTKVYENDKIFAFNDINPKAPVHVLVVHKIHTTSISETAAKHANIYGDIFMAVKEIADQMDLVKKGYRVIINNGKAAGQEVFHLHMHILGGKDNLGPMLTNE